MVVADRAQDGKQPFDLLFVEARGGLVEQPQLGTTSEHRSEGDPSTLTGRQRVHRQVVQARRDLKAAADAAAEIEHGLCSAYLTSWETDGTAEAAHLAQVEDALSGSSLGVTDRHCYHARWVDQVAYRAARIAPTQGTFADSLHRYEQISIDTGIPFVDFRRAHGRASCLWKLGRTEEARVAAAEAATHAGDGGYVRLRSMSLKLQSVLWQDDPDRSSELMARSLAMAARVRDEELLHRSRSLIHASGAVV